MSSTLQQRAAQSVFAGHPLLFWVLLSAVLGLVGLYVYFIQGSVYSIVERKELSREVASMREQIAPLEARYLALRSSVTLERAHELGFENVSRVDYAKVGGEKPVLSRN